MLQIHTTNLEYFYRCKKMPLKQLSVKESKCHLISVLNIFHVDMTGHLRSSLYNLGMAYRSMKWFLPNTLLDLRQNKPSLFKQFSISFQPTAYMPIVLYGASERSTIPHENFLCFSLQGVCLDTLHERVIYRISLCF